MPCQGRGDQGADVPTSHQLSNIMSFAPNVVDRAVVHHGLDPGARRDEHPAADQVGRAGLDPAVNEDRPGPQQVDLDGVAAGAPGAVDAAAAHW